MQLTSISPHLDLQRYARSQHSAESTRICKVTNHTH